MNVLKSCKRIFIFMLALILCFITTVHAFQISDIPDNTLKLGDDFYDMNSNAMSDPKETIPIESLLKDGINHNKEYFKFGGHWYEPFILTASQFLNPAYALKDAQVNEISGFNKWYKAGNEVVNVSSLIAPTNVVACPGNQQIKLTWDTVSGAKEYFVYQADVSGGTYTETAAATNSFIKTGLTKGKTYYFKVKAYNGTEYSDFSSEVSAISNVDTDGKVYDGNYILVDNESTNVDMTESTGNLETNSKESSSISLKQSSLDSGIYSIDPVLTIPKIEKNNIKKNYYSIDKQEESIEYNLGDTKVYKTQNFSSNSAITEDITAVLQYKGTKCNVWVDAVNKNLNSQNAKVLGQEFDNKIYPLITENFYDAPDLDGDGMIDILCFDIKDGFSGSGAYIGGYFNEGDLFPKSLNPISNQCEMFYIDTYPGMGINEANPNVSLQFSTLAHEFQHMVNFNAYLKNPNKSQPMDTWLNEALSLAAEHMYNGVQTSRIGYYNNSSSIRNGHSLLYWDEDGDTLSNYALSYLFSQYLRVQTKDKIKNGESIFKEIIENDNYDSKSVEDVIKKYIDPNMTFGRFMTCFRAALFLKAPDGLYGFKNESDFNLINTQIYSGGGINLRGGGAVVKPVSSSFTDPGNEGADVKYMGLSN